jgi:hypothetical protein
MKIILTEEQFDEITPKIYKGFIDSLVKKTKIFDGERYDYRGFQYVARLEFPFYENIYTLTFNSPSDFTFTVPGRYNLKEWFLLVNVDMDKEPKKTEKLWNLYLDVLEVKIKKYIQDFIENENK